MCSKVLPCPLCSHPNFESVDALRISLVKVANHPLMCPVCNEVLLGLDKFTIHLFSHTIDTHLVAPAVCKEETTSIQPAAEVMVDVKINPQPSQCDICSFLFRDMNLLQIHQNLMHKAPETGAKDAQEGTMAKFQCHLCQKTFKMKGSLRVHLRVVHLYGVEQEPEARRLTEKLKLTEETPNKVNIPPHERCDETFSAPTTRLPTTPSESLPNPQSVAAPQAAADAAKSWECDICAKSFTTKYFLKKHKRLHTGEMPYSCTICGKTFTFQQSYHKHLLYHSDEKPHVCSTCGRAFKELSTLHNHERIHSGEKPFSCETCGKSFRQRVSYLVHRRIHTGAMPYKCTACAKSFRYKVSQRTHKCPAQPPGTVIRQSGDLLQKLLQNASLTPADTDLTFDELNSHGGSDLISQTIDDIVKESCDKMGLSETCSEIFGGISSNAAEDSAASPSDKLQNLCLYSPGQMETINEDSFKQLLYGDGNL
ncbi:zinc finger protein 429 [Lutzomyia longipalpis]|uniref:zinc finger protein 429 n=1 Tax=Lutzomyia longipalpis TaxID=7200 RepID=UPI002483D64E|nr:zinc finger protein 429 [Lutzomyia longipalpis]